jgi:NADH-quinone oxidoreductase subunit G
MVETEGGWVDIACNMPVKAGMKVETESEAVREQRKAMLKFFLLNHPVDCGICDKAGECTLQDYHYEHNGEPRQVRDPKLHSTKYFPLSSRIVLDNERCILCSRCVRFTREVSKSNVLGIEQRADQSLSARPRATPSTRTPTPTTSSTCARSARCCHAISCTSRASGTCSPRPRCAPAVRRGCTIDAWTRKPEWRLKSVDAQENERVLRVTPRVNPEVNGHWICNFARDLGHWFERPRAGVARLKGRAVSTAAAIDAARELLATARQPVALVSSAASNEELEAFKTALGARCDCYVKSDRAPAEGEVIEDELLIRADKNPNTHTATTLFGARAPAFPAGTDLVLVWGEGFEYGELPRGVKVVLLGSWLVPEIGSADVFIPLTTQLERYGHYTNFAGVTSALRALPPAAARGDRRRGAVPSASGGRRRRRMIQDLVIHGIYIVYAVLMLMTLGLILTWVERKQAAIMSDRIGANRAYLRIPFTQVKLVWMGLFHGLADGLKMMLKEDWRPQSYDRVAYALSRPGWPSCRCWRCSR